MDWEIDTYMEQEEENGKKILSIVMRGFLNWTTDLLMVSSLIFTQTP